MTASMRAVFAPADRIFHTLYLCTVTRFSTKSGKQPLYGRYFVCVETQVECISAEKKHNYARDGLRRCCGSFGQTEAKKRLSDRLSLIFLLARKRGKDAALYYGLRLQD